MSSKTRSGAESQPSPPRRNILRGWFELPSGIGEPHLTTAGTAAVWWIPKPRSPRVTLLATVWAWAAALPLVAGTLWWMARESDSLWPFGHPVAGPAELLLRYEIVLIVCLMYVTLKSLPMWMRHGLVARRDRAAIEAAILAGQWERAGLLVHRYCIMRSAFRRRMPGRVAAWDERIRGRLSRHRRFYVYYSLYRPPLPEDVTSSFTPVVTPPPRPPLWSAAGLVPITWLLYMLILDVVRNRYWQRLVVFNAVLLMVILVTYGTYFALMLLGQSHFFRFAPGVLQMVRYRAGRRRPMIETFDLRHVHVALDLSSKWPAVTVFGDAGRSGVAFRLPRGEEAITATFRACLSTAPSPPLPEDDLMG
jgi:hypothetical protein